MEKRKRQRAKRRLTCELVVGEDRYPAIVRDISPTGRFVQTRAKPEAGSVVDVIFAAQGGQPEIRVEAGVARHRIVPPRLQGSVQGGVGIELLSPPPEFQELVARGVGDASGGEAESPPGDAAKSQSIRTFHVRVKQRDKPNARVLTVRSESAAGARARALAQAGRGWMIADIQEV